MVRTIIVDDDFLVRTYLKQLQAWQKAGYEIIADLRDGEDALKALEELGPDMIVTDISMPLMNGIELIKKIRQQNQSVYIVVLSCHDDFDYVKEAMKHGADEYVLKNSLNEDSLREILEHTSNQLKKRKEKFQDADQERKLLDAGRHTMKYHFFNGLLAGTFNLEKRREEQKKAGISAPYMNSAVVNMFIPDWGRLKNEQTELELEQYCQRFLWKLTAELKERGEDADHMELVYLGEGVFCCFVDLSDLRRSVAMRQRVTGIATACFRLCKQEEYGIEVGVSNTCFGEEGIRQAYQQAREVMKLSFYENDNILYYESEPKIGRVLPKEASELLEQARGLAEKDRYDVLKEQMQMTIQAFQKEHTDSKLVVQWVKKLDQVLGVERNAESGTSIVKVTQLMDICEEYRSLLFGGQCRVLPSGINAGIRLAVDFLHTHFREPVGLNETADAAGLNPAYLSYLFKQEMGVGFSNYLSNLRMEYAEHMLMTTNSKVKEVAKQSGFGDYHHFSKVFKKMYGMGPAKYRKEKQNNI